METLSRQKPNTVEQNNSRYFIGCLDLLIRMFPRIFRNASAWWWWVDGTARTWLGFPLGHRGSLQLRNVKKSSTISLMPGVRNHVGHYICWLFMLRGAATLVSKKKKDRIQNSSENIFVLDCPYWWKRCSLPKKNVEELWFNGTAYALHVPTFTILYFQSKRRGHGSVVEHLYCMQKVRFNPQHLQLKGWSSRWYKRPLPKIWESHCPPE